MKRCAVIAVLLGAPLLVLEVQPHPIQENHAFAGSDQAGKKKTPDALKNDLPNPDEPCPGSRQLQETSKLGKYVVSVFRDPNPFGCFEIVRNGRRIWTQTSITFAVGGFNEKTRLPIGTDLNGDGEPDLVIAEWTGGVHCCFRFHVFQIGKTFRKIDTINAGHSDDDAFANLDGDPALEFKAIDCTFAYWQGSFSQSPVVQVILKYQNGKYRFAAGLMRTKPPTLEEIQQRPLKSHEMYAQDELGWWGKMWSEVLRLIYSGNVSSARPYIELAWPSERTDKAKMLDDFRRTLAKSPFFRDVVAINGGRSF